MKLDGEKLLADLESNLKNLQKYEKADIESEQYHDISLRRNFMQGVERAINLIKSGDYTIEDKE